MKIPPSANTGFAAPATQAKRLLATSLPLLQLQANVAMGTIVGRNAEQSVRSFRCLLHKLAIHDDYICTKNEKTLALELARKEILRQQAVPGISQDMAASYTNHLYYLDRLISSYTSGWRDQMFPMLDEHHNDP